MREESVGARGGPAGLENMACLVVAVLSYQ